MQVTSHVFESGWKSRRLVPTAKSTPLSCTVPSVGVESRPDTLRKGGLHFALSSIECGGPKRTDRILFVFGTIAVFFVLAGVLGYENFAASLPGLALLVVAGYLGLRVGRVIN